MKSLLTGALLLPSAMAGRDHHVQMPIHKTRKKKYSAIIFFILKYFRFGCELADTLIYCDTFTQPVFT
jgi:hypothetical protein